MKRILIILTIILTFSACEKENITTINDIKANSKIEDLQIQFAKILAPALYDYPELRTLIKDESLKQFDKDYDVLYQSIKDINIGDKTVSQILASYAKTEDEFYDMVNDLPLLTIFVPTLPNFNPEVWNAENEIPQVAVRINSSTIPYFDAAGKKTIIPEGLIPGFPLVVIKLNERVFVNHQTVDNSGVNRKSLDFSYSFIDESFDGVNNSTNIKRVTPTSGIDIVNIEAYNLGMEWHRDYVYYGLTPTNTTGNYRNNYSEFITSFTMLSDSWYNKISDQTGDPEVWPFKTSTSSTSWTDGFFEFKIEVLINATNGAGTTLTKFFSAKGSDIANVTYKKVNISLYKLDKITAKPYNPNIELVPWDLKNYGMAWKFHIYEVDPSEEYTYSEEISSTFATNFSIEGTIKKIGLKFGLSNTTTSNSTVTRKISLSSDDLGETILTFDQPIIISSSNSTGSTLYTTREISTGWVSLSIEPKKIY